MNYNVSLLFDLLYTAGCEKGTAIAFCGTLIRALIESVSTSSNARA